MPRNKKIELTDIEYNNREAKDFLLSDQYQIVNDYHYDDPKNAKMGIFTLPEQFWPRLPLGYTWKNDGKIPQIHKHTAFPDVPIEIAIYSINKKKTSKSMNYITLFQDKKTDRWVNMQSYANSSVVQVQNMRRVYPMQPKAYIAQDYDVQYMRGHCVDYADLSVCDLAVINSDDRNYIPENSYWGSHIRNHIVKQTIRKVGGAYMQMPYYHEINSFDFTNRACQITNNNTMVPLGVLFSSISSNRTENLSTIRAPWDYDYARCASKPKYKFVLNNLELEDYNEMPTPLVIKKKQLYAEYHKQLEHYQEAEPDNKNVQLLTCAKAAQLEYKKVEYQLNAFLHFNEIGNKIHAKAFLSSACKMAQSLSDYDDKRIIFSGSVLKKITKINKNNKVYKNEDKIEILHQIYKNRKD